MSSEPKHLFTVEEYFALEQASEVRYEYWDGEIVAMSGASPNHNRIAGDIGRVLGNKLLDRCEVFGSDQKVKMPIGPPYVYPDLIVVCGEARFEKIGGLDALLNPTVIVEVLSPRTQDKDLGSKFSHYRSIESLKEYVILYQDRPQALHYSKQSDNQWNLLILSGLDSVLALGSVGCEIPFTEIYRRVKFENGDT